MLWSDAEGVSPGRYQLVFQASPRAPSYAYRLNVRLTPSEAPVFAILNRGILGSGILLRPQ